MKYTIYPGFDEPIIVAEQLVRERQLPQDCLLIFTEYMLTAAEEYVNKIDNIDWLPVDKAFIGKYMDKEIVVLKPYIGAPSTIMALESALAAGVKNIIMVGESGGISEELNIGDYVVPLWGIREEGTSYHYMSPEYTPKPSRDLVEKLGVSLRRIVGDDKQILYGGIWSIDAVFRETRDKVREYSREGVLCVDMEATAVMTLGEYKERDIAVLIVISDLLCGDEWVRGWGTRELEEAEHLAVKVGLKSLI